MGEAPHRLERNRRHGGIGRHEEVVAVRLVEAVVPARDGLLAGDPAGVAARPAARAVHERAADAHELAHQALLLRVEVERDAAAHALRVVAQVRGRVHPEREVARGVAQLVVADEAHDVSAALEAAHAVVAARHDEPAAEGLAGLAEGDVAEVLRQREDGVAVLVGRGLQVAVVAAPAAPVIVNRQRPVRAERGERRAGHHAAGDGAAALEEAATGNALACVSHFEPPFGFPAARTLAARHDEVVTHLFLRRHISVDRNRQRPDEQLVSGARAAENSPPRLRIGGEAPRIPLQATNPQGRPPSRRSSLRGTTRRATPGIRRSSSSRGRSTGCCGARPEC